jgi:hypothetical protein
MLSQLKLQIKLDPPLCNKMQKAAELLHPLNPPHTRNSRGAHAAQLAAEQIVVPGLAIQMLIDAAEDRGPMLFAEWV